MATATVLSATFLVNAGCGRQGAGPAKAQHGQIQEKDPLPAAGPIRMPEAEFRAGLRFADERHYGFLLLRPRKMYASPFVKEVKRSHDDDEQLAEWIIDETGIDFRNSESMAFLFRDGEQMAEPDDPSGADEEGVRERVANRKALLVVRMAQPIDRDLLWKSIRMRRHELRTHQHKEYWWSPAEWEWDWLPNLDASIHFVDDRTMVIGAEDDLKRVMESSASSGRLPTVIQDKDLENDLLLGVALEDQGGEVIPLDDPAFNLESCVKQVDFALLALDLGKAPRLSVRGIFRTEAAADFYVNQARPWVMIAVEWLRENAPGSIGDVPVEISEPTQKLIHDILRSVELARRDSTVEFGIGFPADTPEYMAETFQKWRAIERANAEARRLADLESRRKAQELFELEHETAPWEPPKPDDPVETWFVKLAPVPYSPMSGKSFQKCWQIGEAIVLFHGDKGRYPADIRDAQGTPLLSWRVELLPYLGEQALFDRFRLDEPWDSPANAQLIDRMPDVFGINISSSEGRTDLVSPPGDHTILGSKQPVSIRNLPNGVWNTGLAIQARADQAVTWTRPDSAKLHQALTDHGPGPDGASRTVVWLADGNVHTYSKALFLKEWAALFSMEGGEPTPSASESGPHSLWHRQMTQMGLDLPKPLPGKTTRRPASLFGLDQPRGPDRRYYPGRPPVRSP